MESTIEAVNLFARATHHNNQNCTQNTCPASDSFYGYAPNLGANTFFIAFFAASAAVYFVQIFLYRRWLAFSICLCLGCIAEAIGYAARVMLHNNPFSQLGLKLSIVLLTFAPAFFSASVYLILKQVTLAFSPELSRLKPHLYTWIFISCDILAILLQSAGGAISAVANTTKLIDVGVDVMIAGLGFQVLTLLIFGMLATEYFFRAKKNLNALRPGATEVIHTRKFKLFLCSSFLAYLCIFARCCYRVAELSGGWGNPIMKDEPIFIVFDSVLISTSTFLLEVFHPGLCFPRKDNNTAGFDEPKDELNSASSNEVFEAPKVEA